MSILNFEVPAEAQTPTNKPINIHTLFLLWYDGDLANLKSKETLKSLHEAQYTHLTIGNLERSRQLFMRLMQYKISFKVLDKFWGIIEQVIEEGLEINDENTKKINYLLGDKYKVSKSALYFVADSIIKGNLFCEEKEIPAREGDLL